MDESVEVGVREAIGVVTKPPRADGERPLRSARAARSSLSRCFIGDVKAAISRIESPRIIGIEDTAKDVSGTSALAGFPRRGGICT